MNAEVGNYDNTLDEIEVNEGILKSISEWKKNYSFFSGKNSEEKKAVLKKLKGDIISREVNISVDLLVFFAHIQFSEWKLLTDIGLHECFEDISCPKNGLGFKQNFEIIWFIQTFETISNNSELVRFELSLLLDFFVSILSNIQIDDNPNNYSHENNFWEYYGPSFLGSLCEFSQWRVHNAYHKSWKKVSQWNHFKPENIEDYNYLVNKKFQEIFEMVHWDNINKEDFLPWVGGWSQDDFIYTIKHSLDSYKKRLKHNLYGGYTNVNPLLDIAPWYIWYYDDWKLSKIYRIAKSWKKPTETEIVNWNKLEFNPTNFVNSSKYEHIYDEIFDLSVWFLSNPRTSHASNWLEVLRLLWKLDEQLEFNGDTFIFDLNRIDKEKLHPFVYADLLHRNNEVFKKEYTWDINWLEEVSLDDFWSEVSPLKGLWEEEKYQYLNLISLGTRKKIEDEFWIHFEDFPFMIQKSFLTFVESKSILEIEEFKKILLEIEDKQSFFTTFLACSQDENIWKKIIGLAKLPGSSKIFKAYADLISLSSNLDDDVNVSPFFKVILARGQGLLEEASLSSMNNEKLTIDSKYETSLVQSGAFIKALLSSAWKKETMSIDTFNEKSPDFRIQTFNWWDIIEEPDNIGMVMEENYLKPELFWIKDYKMLLENIHNTYSWIDDELTKVLYEDIPKDLNNGDVKFYMMRKKTNEWSEWELLALCKITKKLDGTIYWWTHYVEPDYRWNFGIGSYVAQLAFNEFKEHDINAIVAKNNPSLEIQLNYSDFVGTKLDTDKWSKNESDLMIWMTLYRNKSFMTKDIKKFPNELLKNKVWENDWYDVMCLDSRHWFDQNYIDNLETKFSEWYVLTRIFYERDSEGYAKLEKTYVVFEREE